jgi:nitronate monooxygenase
MRKKFGSMSDFCALLGIDLPIVQAPMAGVSTPALAAAVSNAGGLGSLGIGASPVAAARKMIEETRALTSRPFNVNVFCHRPAVRDAVLEAAWVDYLRPLFAKFGAVPPVQLREIYQDFGSDDDMFAMLLETRPPVLSFHFGLPAPERLAAFKAAGIRTLGTATNLQEAERTEQAGIDVVVAQGIEAGGHRGMFDPEEHDPALSTCVLVQLLTRRLRIPVLAAGGIMNEQGIKAALVLGASGVQMGTAFLLCPESAADSRYRSMLKSARAYDTRLTRAISGRPARGLTNRLVEAGSAAGSPAAPAYPVCYDLAKALHTAARSSGSDEFAAHWAGQGAPLAEELPAAQLVTKLARALS